MTLTMRELYRMPIEELINIDPKQLPTDRVSLYGYAQCKYCGKEYKKTSPNQRYCSVSCGSKYRYYKPKGKHNYGYAECKYCGKKFKKHTSNHKFCTSDCCNAYSKVGRLRILDRDNYTCIYCGKSSYTDNIELHIDHIKPKNKGGKDIASNLVTSCKNCNLEKLNNILKNTDTIFKEVKKRNKESSINPNQRINL